MTRSPLLLKSLAALVAAALIAAAAPALADHHGDGGERHEGGERGHHGDRGGDRGSQRTGGVTDPLVRKECGECHMAFPAWLLPAGSWVKVMDTLDDHFGDRATLPADQVATIKAYLTSNAGRGNPELLRISEQRWFVHEHDFNPKRWAAPEVKSKANCAACHKGADRGFFDDDDDD